MNLPNQISLDNFVLNVSRASERGITFNYGEILKGQVSEIKDNGLISIFIKGKLIEAATEVMVNKGQQLFLMVDDVRDGKVVLKVLTPELLSKIENTNIAANLRNIGVTADNDNLAMAKKLIQHNLPVTADMLKNMARGVNLLGANTPRNLEIVGLAMAKQVPLNNSTLQALAQFVEGKPDLASLLRELTHVIARLTDESKGQMAPPNLGANRAMSQTSAPIRELIIPAEEAAKGEKIAANRNLNNAEVLRGNINNKVFIPSPESESRGQMPSTANIATSTNLASTSQLTNLTNNILPLLNQLLENLTLPINSGADTEQIEKIVQALQNNLTNDKDFIRNLALVKDIIKQIDSPALNKALINTLISNMEDLEKEFIGQRVFNVMTKGAGDSNLNYYYVSFPVKIEDEYRLCQLKIDKKLGSKTLLEQDNIKIAVSLATANLGEVLFHVDWYKKGLIKLQGVVETDFAATYIRTNIKSLLSALEGKDYTVEFNGITVVSDEAEEMRVHLNELDEVIKPYVIDIRI
ncbi:MAG: hypothetical protein GX333_05965 [Syntrophomonadaceae bacterium]|nr:hypothetical protein [Syntrophomonadaceae bacterium]